MTTVRRIAYVVLGIALTHLIFGAIVRITGSGMGCGPHWPKCYGWWFPPMDRMDLVIEVMHRYLASVLLLSLLVLVVAAWRRRGEQGMGGRGGVLRASALALALGISAALLGAVTVKLGNSTGATVGHWTVAMALVAAVTAAAIRAGGLGGAAARLGGASRKSRVGTLAAAVLALAAVVLGGLTAKVPGGSVACLSFPLCGANPDVARGAIHVQYTHRVIAFLLVLHLVGLFFALRKRGEAPVVRRAASIALGLGVLQILIAGAMIGMRLPPVLRSLHEATGVSIWIACFALAYLARLASSEPDGGGSQAPRASRPDTPAGPPAQVPLEGVLAGAQGMLALPLSPAPSALLATAIPVASSPHVAEQGGAMPSLVSAAMPGLVIVASTLVAPERPPAPERSTHPQRADDPIELPAALQHAARIVAASALVLHQLSADAAVRAAEREVASHVVVDIAALEVDAGAPAPWIAADTEVVPSAELGADGIVAAGEAPPQWEGTAGDALDRHPQPARVTVFEGAEGAPEALSYNLVELDADEDEDLADLSADDDGWSLDEEFTRQALDAELAEAEALARAEALRAVPASVARAATAEEPRVAPPLAPPVAPPVALPGALPAGLSTAEAVTALRRRSMTHSVAVIVARGADL